MADKTVELTVKETIFTEWVELTRAQLDARKVLNISGEDEMPDFADGVWAKKTLSYILRMRLEDFREVKKRQDAKAINTNVDADDII